MSELGDNVQDYTSVAEKEGYMPKFSLHERRIPTEKLSRIYIPIFIPQATNTVEDYVVGVVPHDGYVVDIKHVCKTVTAATTVEVEIGSKEDIMTADDGSTDVETVTLNDDVSEREVDAGDIINVNIATGSGDLLHLAILITLEPKG